MFGHLFFAAEQGQRNLPDGAHVGGHVLASPPVAAGGGDGEVPILVDKLDGETVVLGLGDQVRLLAKPLPAVLQEPLYLVLIIGCLEAEHRSGVLDRAHILPRLPSDLLRGGGLVPQVRKLILQGVEVLHQPIVLSVGYDGVVLDVVAVVVVADSLAQVADGFAGVLLLVYLLRRDPGFPFLACHLSLAPGAS